MAVFPFRNWHAAIPVRGTDETSDGSDPPQATRRIANADRFDAFILTYLSSGIDHLEPS
jgi:hypothetical protein